MNNYIFYYNKFLKKISKNKHTNIINYLLFIIIFSIYYFYKNWIFSIFILVMLAFFSGNYLHIVISFLLASLSAYFCHWVVHHNEFMNNLCGHSYHHIEKSNWINHLVEFISDVFAAGGYLLIINYLLAKCDINLLNNMAIVYFMISFPLVHILNYHYLIPKSYHHYHHVKTDKNFSPDIYDHLFNTNDGPYFENLVHMIPIFLIVGVLLIYININLK